MIHMINYVAGLDNLQCYEIYGDKVLRIIQRDGILYGYFG